MDQGAPFDDARPRGRLAAVAGRESRSMMSSYTAWRSERVCPWQAVSRPSLLAMKFEHTAVAHLLKQMTRLDRAQMTQTGGLRSRDTSVLADIPQNQLLLLQRIHRLEARIGVRFREAVEVRSEPVQPAPAVSAHLDHTESYETREFTP